MAGSEAIKPPPGHFSWLDHEALDRVCRLNGAAARVYLQLVRHADSQRRCWPSISRLARLLEVNRSTVVRCIDILTEAGLIHVEKRRRSNGGQESNRYFLPLVTPQDPSGTHATPQAHPRNTPGAPTHTPVASVRLAPGAPMPPELDTLQPDPSERSTKDLLEFSWKSARVDSVLALACRKFSEGSDAIFGGPLDLNVCETLLQIAAAVEMGIVAETWVDEALEAIRRHDGPVSKPFPYFMTTLRDVARKQSAHLGEILGKITIPGNLLRRFPEPITKLTGAPDTTAAHRRSNGRPEPAEASA